MSRKAFITALGVLGGLVVVLVILYMNGLFTPKDPYVEAKKEEGNTQAANAETLIAKSHIPGFWVAAVERDPIVTKGTVYEIDKATVQELVFRSEKRKGQVFDAFKKFFDQEDWKAGTDDYDKGKLSFSKDTVGQIVFVLIEEVQENNVTYSQISLQRLIAHE